MWLADWFIVINQQLIHGKCWQRLNYEELSKVAKILKKGDDAAQEIRGIIDSLYGFTYINIEKKFKQVKVRVVIQKTA